MKQLICVLLIFSFSSCIFKSSDYYISEAGKLESQGRYEEAVVFLDKAIENDPKNIYALTNRGVDKSYLEDFDGAIEDYSKILEIDERNTLAFLNRGENKMRINDYKEAIEDFNKAIATKGSELLYINKVENPFVDTGFEFDVAMEEIRFERGLARYYTDSLNTAFKDFSFCIQEGYELSTCYYMTGLIHLSYNNIDDGCNCLRTSKQLGDPDAQEIIDRYCK